MGEIEIFWDKWSLAGGGEETKIPARLRPDFISSSDVTVSMEIPFMAFLGRVLALSLLSY